MSLDPRLLSSISQGANLGQVWGDAVKSGISDEKMRLLQEAMQQYDFDPAANSDMSWLMANDPDRYNAQIKKFDGISKKRKQEYLEDMTNVRNQLNMGNLDGAYSAIEERIAKIQSRGGDPTDSIRLMKILQADPAYALQGLNDMVMVSTGVDFGQSASKTAGMREFESLAGKAGLSEAEKAKAARISLGLDPRAVGSSMQTISQNENLTGNVAEAEKKVNKAREAGKLLAQLDLEPEVKRAVETAANEVKVAAEIASKKRSGQSALNVYKLAASNLSKALNATDTGTLVGLIPALSSDQKIAEGAIAVMRPILKDIVRSDGEGAFSDGDQAVIDGLIPQRTDDIKAVEMKLRMLDMFVYSTLGAELPKSTNQPQQSNVIRYDENGNRVK